MKDVNCALEINSSSYSLVVLDAGLRILAAKRINFDFDIRDLSLVDEVSLGYLRRIMKELVQEYGFRIKKFNICLPHYQVDIVPASAEIVLHPYRRRDVKRRDIKNLIDHSRLLRIDWDKNIIHSLPTEFYLDGRKFLEAPLGVYGRKLMARNVFCIVDRSIAEELEILAEKLSVELGRMVFYPLSLMSLFDASRLEDSFLLVRMRRYRTDMAVFIKSALVYAGYVSVGGSYIDKEISDAFGISMRLAEEIKIEYGALNEEDLKDEREVIIKKVSSYRSIKRSKLNQVLLSSFQNILGSIKSNIPEELWTHISRVLLVGNISYLKGLREIVEGELELQLQPLVLIRDEYGQFSPSFWGAIGSFYFQDSIFNRQRYAMEDFGFWRRIVNVWDNYF